MARRGTLLPGDTLQLRARSGDAGSTVQCTVAIGEVADDWAVSVAP